MLITAKYEMNLEWYTSSYILYIDEDDDNMTHFVQGDRLQLNQELRIYVKRLDGFVQYTGAVSLEPAEQDTWHDADTKFMLKNWEFYKQFFKIKIDELVYYETTSGSSITGALHIYDALGRLADPRKIDIGW